ncbi:hypothetical protein [Phaffia rhodozyma]|uniref:Uncharacterized protein n=1 Tax=Phaffia rhodozyma TaxID=264483 RepID=A0A0F7SMF5_PHARH|nr:hypothetical protein [Phaffia rhodozyma]
MDAAAALVMLTDMIDSSDLTPPLILNTLSTIPIPAEDTHAHLAAFLAGFQARSRENGGKGEMESSLLGRLVESLQDEKQ